MNHDRRSKNDRPSSKVHALDRTGFGADLGTFRSLVAICELLDPYAPTSMPPCTSEDPIFLAIAALVVLLLLGSADEGG